MNMPLDYLNTLYKLGIDREKAELKQREEQNKLEATQKYLEDRAIKAERSGDKVRAQKIRDKLNKMDQSTPILSKRDLELIEDELGG